jgi:hypothetical protein
MSHTCGDCTACCKILGVKEIAKPAGQWCPDCKIGYGCKVYHTRPESCRIFECDWLQESSFPADLRPDKCKVVITSTIDGEHPVLWVDPAYPDAWQKYPVKQYIDAALKCGVDVIIACNDRRKLVSSRGVSPEVTIDPNEDICHLQVSDIGPPVLINIKGSNV